MTKTSFIAKQLLKKAKIVKNKSLVLPRHNVLNKRYKENPELAMITDHAEVIGTNFHDPFRTEVVMSDELSVPFTIGVHRAVGGDHDYPNPGDMLCATLASCMESTLRMIANRYEIKLTKTVVKVSALVDVRGTLRTDPSVPVNFQSMNVDIEVAAEGLDDKMLKILVAGAKKSCIIYQTLKKGIPVKINTNLDATRN